MQLVVGLSFSSTLLPLATRVPQAAIVFVVMFFMALSVDFQQMSHALRSPGPVSLGVLLNSVLAPLLAWPIASLLRADLGYGLLVAAAVPSTLTSAAVWTRQAGGNDTVSVLITLVTNGLCFLVTPAWLWMATGTDVRIEPRAMILDLALTVVVPMILGQAARLWKPAAQVADRRKTLLSGVAQVGILLIIGVGAIYAGDELRRHAGAERAVGAWDWCALLAAVVGIHTATLAAGHASAYALGISREDRIAIGFSGSQKTLMIGLRTALAAFGGLAMLPMVAYHICQLLVDTLVADWLKRRA